MVESGDVLGAIDPAAGPVEKLQSLGGLDPESPTIEVLVNEDDPIKARLVDDRISALLAKANLRISPSRSPTSRPATCGSSRRRRLQLPRRRRRCSACAVERDPPRRPRPAPAGRPDLDELDQVIHFATSRAENLGVAPTCWLGLAADQGRQAGRQRRRPSPRQLRDRGRRDGHADVRDRPARRRLARARARGERVRAAHPRPGLPPALLGEKVAARRRGLARGDAADARRRSSLFVSLDWGRFPLWIPAIVAGGAGFAAFGAAIGAPRRRSARRRCSRS